MDVVAQILTERPGRTEEEEYQISDLQEAVELGPGASLDRRHITLYPGDYTTLGDQEIEVPPNVTITILPGAVLEYANDFRLDRFQVGNQTYDGPVIEEDVNQPDFDHPLASDPNVSNPAATRYLEPKFIGHVENITDLNLASEWAFKQEFERSLWSLRNDDTNQLFDVPFENVVQLETEDWIEIDTGQIPNANEGPFVNFRHEERQSQALENELQNSVSNQEVIKSLEIDHGHIVGAESVPVVVDIQSGNSTLEITSQNNPQNRGFVEITHNTDGQEVDVSTLNPGNIIKKLFTDSEGHVIGTERTANVAKIKAREPNEDPLLAVEDLAPSDPGTFEITHRSIGSPIDFPDPTGTEVVREIEPHLDPSGDPTGHVQTVELASVVGGQNVSTSVNGNGNIEIDVDFSTSFGNIHQGNTSPPGDETNALQFVNEIEFDQFGHVTSLGTGQVVTSLASDSDITVSQSTGDVTVGIGSLSQFDTDDLDEGSSNLYFKESRVDSAANSLLEAGNNISLDFQPGQSASLTINAPNEDVQDAVYNNVLSGTQTLIDVSYSDQTNEVDFVVNDDLSQYDNSSAAFSTYTSADFDTDFAAKSTDELSEGTSNLYFTDERAQDAAAAALVGGQNVNVSYDDGADQITVSSNTALTVKDGGNQINQGVNVVNFGDDISASQTSGNSVEVSFDVNSSGVTGTTADAFIIDTDGSNPLQLRNDGSGEFVVETGSGGNLRDLKVRNLTVDGTTTTINTEELTVADNKILLNSNTPNVSNPTQDAGIEVKRGSQSNAILNWNETQDYWEAGTLALSRRILTTDDATNFQGDFVSRTGDIMTGKLTVDSANNSNIGLLIGDPTSENFNGPLSFRVETGDVQFDGSFGFDTGTAVDEIKTTVADPGANTKLATEAAIRSAIGSAQFTNTKAVTAIENASELNLTDTDLTWSRDTDSATLHFVDYGNDSDYLTVDVEDNVDDVFRIRGTNASNSLENVADFGFDEIRFYQTPNVNGNTMWHAGNDGSGSGLDADTLDGTQLSDIGFGDIAASRYTDGEARGAIEAGDVDHVQFSNIEDVNDGQIGRDNSVGFLGSWGGNGTAVLWDSNNVSGGTDISISGGTGPEGQPTINHANTSSQGNVSAPNGGAIADINLDGNGHVTNINTVDFDSRFDDYGNWRVSATGGNGTANIGSDERVNFDGGPGINTGFDVFSSNPFEVTITHANTSNQGDVSAGSGSAINSIELDFAGHVTNIGTSSFDDYGNWVIEEGDGEQSIIGSGQKLEIFGGDDLNTEIVSTGGETRLRVAHDNTGGAQSTGNSGGTVIQSVNTNNNGHVNGINTTNLDGRFVRESGDTMTGALTVQANITSTQDIRANGDVIAFFSSDRRKKTNIKEIGGPLDKIGRITGYEFDWKKAYRREGSQYGLIAQEVQKVLPKAVNERNDGTLAVDYNQTIPLLTNAVKELRNRVESQQEQIENQQRQINELQEQLNQ